MRTSSPVARHIEPIERLHRRLRLAFGGAEGGEVVLADERLRGRVHGVGIEPARHAPGARALQREIGAAVDDAVEVVALPCREPRIEVVGDLLGGQNRDRMRPQVRIHRIAQLVGAPVLREIDMRDLAERVHARIGAPRAGDLHGMIAAASERLGQHALHARADALHLPADERRAVILDGELVARHASMAPKSGNRFSDKAMLKARLAKFVEGRRIADLAASRRAFVQTAAP